MELTDVSTDAIVALAKERQTKWCFIKDLVLIKVLRQEKSYEN